MEQVIQVGDVVILNETFWDKPRYLPHIVDHLRLHAKRQGLMVVVAVGDTFCLCSRSALEYVEMGAAGSFRKENLTVLENLQESE